MSSFDADGFRAALHRARMARNLSWRQVATEAGVSPSTLTRNFTPGKHPDLNNFAKLVQWLGCSADPFLRVTPEPVDKVEDVVRTLMQLGLDADTASAFGHLITLLRAVPSPEGTEGP